MRALSHSSKSQTYTPSSAPKRLLLLAAAALFLTGCGAGNAASGQQAEAGAEASQENRQEPIQETSREPIRMDFEQEAVRLTVQMGKLAGDQGYVGAMGMIPDAMDEVELMAAQDYSAPEEIKELALPEDLAEQIFRQSGGEVQLSPEAEKALNMKIDAATLSSVINSKYGTDPLVAANSLIFGESYIQPENWESNVVYLLEYPGEYSAMVTFISSGEGVITGRAAFVKAEGEELIDLLQPVLGL